MGLVELKIWQTVAALCTVAIFSFLYRDNPLYKFAEHLLVGTSVGYMLAVAYQIVLKPRVIDALLDPGVTIWVKFYTVMIPTAIGLCYLSSFSRKYSWLTRYPISYIMGLSVGLSLPMTMIANILRQIRGTFAEEMGGELVPLLSVHKVALFFQQPSLDGFMEALYGPAIIVGVLSVMLLFVFSFEQKGPLKVARNVGIVYLMIGFGAAFGYTVMARVSLLVGRIDFLLIDYLGIL